MTLEDHENIYVCALSQPRFEPDANTRGMQAQSKRNVSIFSVLDIAG
jgi:hypothetical protein